MILDSRLELKNVQTAISKHLEILQKIKGGGKSVKVWVNTASSATKTCCLVYSVMWCGGSVKCLFSVFPVIFLSGHLAVNNFICKIYQNEDIYF